MAERLYIPEPIERKEAAQLLRVSVGTLEKMRQKEPNFPQPMRFGRVIRYDKRSLVEWFARKTAQR